MNPCVVCPAGHPVVVHPSKLGSEVACPRCLEFFRAERPRLDTEHASKESGKRPAKKKPDDDEDEDEKPSKKKPAKPSKDAKDDKKKPAVKKKKEDDDDEEDEDDEEEAENPEDDITWNARKKGLKTCHSGLAFLTGGYFGLILLYVLTLSGVSMASSGPNKGMYDTGIMVLKFGALPTAHVALAFFVIGMFMNIRVPAKAEAGVGLYSSLALGLFTFFVAVMMIIASTGAFFEDPARTERIVSLLFGAVVLCFIATWMAMMGYLCSVLTFMRMTNDASMPITNGVFGSLPFVGMLALHFLGATLRSGIGEFMGWAIIGLSVGLGGYAIYMLVLQLSLTNRLRAKIWDHIVWG